MITDQFIAIAGSVIGTEHRRTGRNNQDGYHIAANGYVLSAAEALVEAELPAAGKI